jgi:sugar/nucleoside kinase (ribokinase family)
VLDLRNSDSCCCHGSAHGLLVSDLPALTARPSKEAGMGDFFSFGNLAIDDLVYADGTTNWRVAGGAAMYAALGMAVWAGTAATVAPFGPDYPCEVLQGIEFACKRRLPASMRNWGLYEEDGSRHFLSRWASSDWEAASPRVDDLDGGPYLNCHIGPMPWTCASVLIDALRERGASTISLDIHDRKLAGVTIDDYVALVHRVDVFLPSTQDVGEYLPGLSPLEALRALRARLPGVQVIGIKRGRDGVIVHAAGGAEILSVPSASFGTVDITGAGDAFCGGFLVGYAQSGDALEGALCGSISAAYAISAPSANGLLAVNRAEARERMNALRAGVTRLPFDAS